MNKKSINYFPIGNSKFEFKPGLIPLHKADFDNGEIDKKIFQIDGNFKKYRKEKLKSRKENLKKYFLTDDYYPQISGDIIHFLISRLVTEYPNLFYVEKLPTGTTLFCSMTGETLYFGDKLRLIGVESEEKVYPPYSSALDAIACQVQEDIAILTKFKNKEKLVSLHICFPSRWKPEDKIGKSFLEIHEPVPEIKNIKDYSNTIINALFNHGPFVRFAWTLSTTSKLNLYPDFLNEEPSNLFFRVERQTVNPLKKIQSCLFTIRPYLYDFKNLNLNQKNLIRNQIKTMPENVKKYKGINSKIIEKIIK